MRYQLDMQILLVSTTIFVVFWKANIVQLIRSASRVWSNALFKQVWTWYLRTLQNNSLRNSRHSWPSRQTELQRDAVKTWDVWVCSPGYRLLSVELILLSLFSMTFFCRILCVGNLALRSALSYLSAGWKKNKIHAVLGIKIPRTPKNLASMRLFYHVSSSLPSWAMKMQGDLW